MGREARRGYDLAQVEIVPSRRTRSSQEVSTAWQLDAYRFDDPADHPPDRRRRLAGERRRGSGSSAGWPCSTPRGCGPGTPTPTARWPGCVEAAAADDPAAAVRLLQELHAAPITAALLTEALRTVREAGVTVAARVSPQRARELTPDLLAAGVEVLVVQGTIISAEHVSGGRAAEPQGLHRLARRAGRRGRRAATTAPPCTSCAPARPA